MKDLVGEVVGNYRIESLIDEGGMGRVYRARHIHLNRPAAIKIMLPELEVIPGYRARFLQEARAAAALRHPNVVEVLDFGEHEGHCFLVMELVPDGNLLTLMRGLIPGRGQPGSGEQADARPLSLALGLELVSQACFGLDYAHELGMVHRDVKPANLLLDASGRRRTGQTEPYTLKVSDFGLARLKEGGVETTIGKIRGTLAYMSPEQCRGQKLDGRSDLYALGIILFELSTGRRPFEVSSPTDALYKHIYESPPSPRHFRPELPSELESIILRCLAKAPDERYPSCASLGADLLSLVQRGVLVGGSTEDATRVDENADVSTSLHSLPLGVLVEPPEVVEEEQEGKGIGQAEGKGSEEGARPARPQPRLPRIRLYDQRGETLRLLDLTGEGLSVGRLPDNDLVLETEGISRHHLRVEWDGSAASVTDLGSRNGTFLQDGTRLVPGISQPWKPLESLRVGGCWLRLEGASESAAVVGTASAPVSRTEVGAPAGSVEEAAPETSVEPTLEGIGEATAVRAVDATAVPRTADEPAVAVEPTEISAMPSLPSIELAVEPAQLRLTPGLLGHLSVRIANRGNAAERLGVLVEGVPEGWLARKGEEALVNPGAEATIELSVLVPLESTTRAGDYPVTVRATRRMLKAGGSPEETLAGEWQPLPFTASGRWTVGEVVRNTLALLPERLRALRVAEYQVRLENEGNSASTFDLSATESEQVEGDGKAVGGPGDGKAETLVYEFSQPKVTLEPGQSTELSLRVKAPARLVGVEETHPFLVQAKPSEGGVLSARAELVRRALLPIWATLAAAVLFALTAIAVIAYSLPSLQPIWMGQFQGSTPVALDTPEASASPEVASVDEDTPTPESEAPMPSECTPTKPSGKVQLCDEADYCGTCEDFEADDSDLGDDDIGDDKASSLRIPPGQKVAVFEHVDYDGVCQEFDADTPNLAETEIQDDSISSIRVGMGCPPAEATDGATPTSEPDGIDWVTPTPSPTNGAEDIDWVTPTPSPPEGPGAIDWATPTPRLASAPKPPPTNTPRSTPTDTPVPTPTNTPTKTRTPTRTPTNTPTKTPTPKPVVITKFTATQQGSTGTGPAILLVWSASGGTGSEKAYLTRHEYSSAGAEQTTVSLSKASTAMTASYFDQLDKCVFGLDYTLKVGTTVERAPVPRFHFNCIF